MEYWIYIIAPLVVTFVIFVGKRNFKNRQRIHKYIKKIHLIAVPVSFNLALSLDFKEGLNSGNYFNQILKNLKELINRANLENEIKVKNFSDIHKFKDRKQAEKFRGDKNIGLLIWGGFTNDYGRTYKEGKKIGAKDGFRAIWCILKYNIWDRKYGLKITNKI